MNCKDNPTCALTCRTLCLDAVERAQAKNTCYEHALELIIKSRIQQENQ